MVEVYWYIGSANILAADMAFFFTNIGIGTKQ